MEKDITIPYLREKYLEIIKNSLDTLIKEENELNKKIQESNYIQMFREIENNPLVNLKNFGSESTSETDYETSFTYVHVINVLKSSIINFLDHNVTLLDRNQQDVNFILVNVPYSILSKAMSM